MFKANQVLSASAIESKAYDFEGEAGRAIKGVSIYSTLTAMSANGQIAIIKLKGKTEDEVKAKIAKYSVGKPAEIPVAVKLTGGVMVLNG